MLSNNIKAPDFLFPEILKALKKTAHNQKCFWVKCAEVDGAIATIDVISAYNGEQKPSEYDKPEYISYFEYTTWEETQSGDCHLLLISSDFDWLLKLTYDFKKLTIELHGEQNFLQSFDQNLSKIK